MNNPCVSHAHPTRAARVFLTLVLSLALTACGAGGGASGDSATSGNGVPPGNSPNTPFAIEGQAMPMGYVGTPYEAAQITTVGAENAVDFVIDDGSLPPGLELALDGRILGAPSATGIYSFVVEATDHENTDSATFTISVETFGVAIVDGLQFDEAWSGCPITVHALGTPSATFTATTNASGGQFQIQNDGVTAKWIPGDVSSFGAEDVLTVRSAGGETEQLTLHVMPDPMTHHEPDFGSADVWHVDFEGRNGSHAYATDLHAALASVGLRNPSSLSRAGTKADQLAALYVKLRFLGHLNTMYLREDNGSAGNDGLPISFVVNGPGAGYFKPGPGGWLPGQSDRYSAISVIDIATHGTVGAALVDEVGNNLHMNNAPGSSIGTLGVFINRIMPYVRGTYRTEERSTADAPVDADDESRLLALIHGAHPSTLGGRAEDIAYVANAIGRSVAAVCAHEIGHSLGLTHTETTTPGSIMNYAATIHPAAQYFFLPEDLVKLETSLPGVGRVSGGSSKMSAPLGYAAQTLPGNGVRVCGGRCKGH